MTSPPRLVVDEAALRRAPTLLPHAPPFRLIDRVRAADLVAGTLTAERRLSAGCALWPAESGGLTFPEVLVIEALCQAAACLNILESAPDVARPHHGYLVAISNFRFQPNSQPGDPAQLERPRVGDTLVLKVERGSRMGALVAFSVAARVERDAGPVAYELASGQLLFAIGQSF